MKNLNDILGVVLGGGRGSRLYPLTKMRSKPAVPMGGKYRLIDIPISNCINSGIYRIAVLTQFNSVSLNRHITRTYNFDAFHTGWVQVWAAEQTMQNSDWYQGTADAVRKQLFEIASTGAEYILVLAGDHLYRMDYAALAKFHWQTNADITVAVQPVARKDVERFGILKQDADHRITDFFEKPKDPDVISTLASGNNPEKPFLGSMGIYLFNRDILFDLLQQNTFDDFGGHLLPHAIKNHAVYGFDFNGYWEDIGTIRSFYETNLALTIPNPPFNLYDTEHPIYTHARFLPGSRVEDSRLTDVLLADGCQIEHAEITHSVIGLRSWVGAGTKIRDSILMGADYYLCGPAALPLGIGPGCVIEGAIIDKNARIGAGVIIRSFPQGTDIDTDTWVVRDGIVVVPKDTTIQPGTVIEPGAGKY